FLFSNIRRHTRSYGDWSSDVCSSDLDLVPQARVEIGHGQMDADELEEVMARFVAGKIDVLVCTTIIESGLDIPNANTIVIDRAEDRKSTRLNSSHRTISYAVFCLKKK